MKQVYRQIVIQLSLFIAMIFSCISLYQHWLLKYSGGVARGFCDGTGVVGCDAVSVSPWAEPFFGLPVASIAIGLFVLIITLELIPKFKNRTAPLYLLMSAASVFYLVIMIFSVGQICLLCLATHACIWIATILKLKQSQHIWNDNWVWRLGATIPLVFAFTLQQWALPTLRQKKGWERMNVSENDFRSVTVPVIPSDFPRITLGKTGGKKINMTVAVDFLCLHCRDHFFELSRALTAAGKTAEVLILMNPMDETCNPAGGNLNPGACNVARVGLCQYERGKFEPFFRNIYLVPGRGMGRDPNTLLTLESSSPQEKAELEECTQSEKTKQKLDQHLQIVQKSDIIGTPVTWIKDYQFTGQLGWKDWSEIFKRIHN